jgi:chromosome partitioning protein
MAGRVITIAQRKGGAGKTTLAAQLAVAWARSGARVAVLDIDPQGSLAAWAGLRRARLGNAAIGFEFAALPGWRAEQWIGDQARDADNLVIYNPPHVETQAPIAVSAAGLVVIPVQPSPLDLWATEATLTMAKKERRPALAVLNRVPPRSPATGHVATDLGHLGATIAATRVGNRVAFVQAMAQGLGVLEIAASGPAAAEIAALAAEVMEEQSP